jgi:hypothetical protein
VTRVFPAAALCFALISAPASAAQPPRFTVTVILSAKAAEKLAAARESINAAAYYSGQPTRAAMRRAVDGEIDLGREDVPLPGTGGAAAFVGKGYKADRLKFVSGPTRLLVNVFSARRALPDNLLACGIFEGTLDEAAAGPVAIKCGLIGEAGY